MSSSKRARSKRKHRQQGRQNERADWKAYLKWQESLSEKDPSTEPRPLRARPWEASDGGKQALIRSLNTGYKGMGCGPGAENLVRAIYLRSNGRSWL